MTHLQGSVPVYESVSPDGSTQVYGSTAFKLTFDRFLEPLSAVRQAICVQPRLDNVNGPEGCTNGVFFTPAYDPVRREVVYRPGAGQAPLSPDDLYKFTAYVGVTADAGGFRTFEGTPLAAPFVREFQVRMGAGAPDPAPTSDQFCNSPCASACGPSCETDPMGKTKATCVKDCVDACPPSPRSVSVTLSGCATCHANSADGKTVAAEGLDLSSAAAIAATAIGHTAHGTQTGEHAQNPDESPPRFGRAMPILDPLFPGNSYLLYKLLASHETPLENPPDPVEVQRLRRSLVVGIPMPPSTEPKAFLNPGEAEWISAWLAQGAPAPLCP